MDRSVEELIVDCTSCNDEMFTVLDLSSFVNLKLFEVGNYSFIYVNEVKLIGLHALERVLIRKHCFTKDDYDPDDEGMDPNRYFFLKDCEQLKELKIGNHSMEQYSVCEIANVPSLEVIEMGESNESSTNFFWASLELKSDGDGME